MSNAVVSSALRSDLSLDRIVDNLISSIRLTATERCTGGGSNPPRPNCALPGASLWIWGLGRVGRSGGVSSLFSPGLQGGLLPNGDVSLVISDFFTKWLPRGSGKLAGNWRAGAGLSKRGAGGGGGCFSTPSRLISPDRRGGGGEGGRDEASRETWAW